MLMVLMWSWDREICMQNHAAHHGTQKLQEVRSIDWLNINDHRSLWFSKNNDVYCHLHVGQINIVSVCQYMCYFFTKGRCFC